MPDRGIDFAAMSTHNGYELPQLTLRLDQAWRILTMNQELIRSADQKSYLLIVISTVLVSYVSANLDKIARTGALEKTWLFLFFFAVAAFFYFALTTLLARARIGATASAKIPNLIFFANIAERATPDEYAENFHAADLQAVLDDVCHQIYQVAAIATNKFRAYRRAWIALLCEISMFLALEFSIIR
jgi:hypothetical protein